MSTAAFLTDTQFRKLAAAGHSLVEPFEDSFVQAASIDLRLGNVAYRYKFDRYVLGQEISDSDYSHEQFSELEIGPNSAAFIGLEEVIQIPSDCIGFIFPRSSITRLGITVPPIYMNPGYAGRPPVTLINNTSVPVQIVPRVRIAQLLCAQLSITPKVPYDASVSSKYLDEDNAPSRLHSDDEIRSALERVLKDSLPSHLFERQ
jgi:dCTP deaminase